MDLMQSPIVRKSLLFEKNDYNKISGLKIRGSDIGLQMPDP